MVLLTSSHWLKWTDLKIEDAFNNDIPIAKRVFDDKSESFYFYC